MSKLIRADGEEITLPSMLSARPALAGDRFVAIGGSGGGYGPPEERDPAKVLDDFLDGYVSRSDAEEIYRVIIDEAGALDTAATEATRAVES
jgi:N-methylhydantoinase B